MYKQGLARFAVPKPASSKASQAVDATLKFGDPASLYSDERVRNLHLLEQSRILNAPTANKDK